MIQSRIVSSAVWQLPIRTSTLFTRWVWHRFLRVFAWNSLILLVAQDDEFVIFRDRSPGSKVHLLAIPKRHIGAHDIDSCFFDIRLTIFVSFCSSRQCQNAFDPRHWYVWALAPDSEPVSRCMLIVPSLPSAANEICWSSDSVKNWSSSGATKVRRFSLRHSSPLSILSSAQRLQTRFSHTTVSFRKTAAKLNSSQRYWPPPYTIHICTASSLWVSVRLELSAQTRLTLLLLSRWIISIFTSCPSLSPFPVQ